MLYHGMVSWKEQPDQSVFNALLRLSAQLKADQLPITGVYVQMKAAGIQPNEYTFSAVFHAATCQLLLDSKWLLEVCLLIPSARDSVWCIAFSASPLVFDKAVATIPGRHHASASGLAGRGLYIPEQKTA